MRAHLSGARLRLGAGKGRGYSQGVLLRLRRRRKSQVHHKPRGGVSCGIRRNMIEVLALASAVSTIAGGISSAVQAGKDVGSVLPQFGKLAKLEADISLAEQGRHKGPLGRLTSTEEEGFAIANAKMKHKEAMDTLRSHCRLYGPPGMWETVQREMGAARARQKKALDEEAAKRDRIFYFITVAIACTVFAVGSGGLIWVAALLADEVR